MIYHSRKVDIWNVNEDSIRTIKHLRAFRPYLFCCFHKFRCSRPSVGRGKILESFWAKTSEGDQFSVTNLLTKYGRTHAYLTSELSLRMRHLPDVPMEVYNNDAFEVVQRYCKMHNITNARRVYHYGFKGKTRALTCSWGFYQTDNGIYHKSEIRPYKAKIMEWINS
jgi:hypothetical protein